MADARTQRGGIHSDPLVRLLAYRAWGERDRRWFESEEHKRGQAIRDLHNLRRVARDARTWIPPRAQPGDFMAGFDATGRAYTACIVEMKPDGTARVFTSSIITEPRPSAPSTRGPRPF